jgi:RNA polymerase sigma-70 factor (ECF subfamily)
VTLRRGDDQRRRDVAGANSLTPDAASSERALIERARTGDEDAFEQIVMLHADRVYGALRRFGLEPGDADDVAQEVFLRAWRALDRFEERAQLSTWLYRIAFNEAQRRLGRREPPSVAPAPDGEDPALAIADAPERGPAARALEREFEAVLEHALKQLPMEWRAAVVLRDLEGLSSKDAAMTVGVREAAFKSRLHRGRMELRGLLEPYLGLEEE